MSRAKKSDDYSALQEIDDSAIELCNDFENDAKAESSQVETAAAPTSNNYDSMPMRRQCKYCSCEIVTYVEQEAHPFFAITCLIVLVIYGFLSFLIIPVLYLLTISAVHRCSRCLQVLGRKDCVGMPEDLSQPIWNLKLGKCIIVTSRIYAILGFILAIILSSFYVYIRPSYTLQDNPLFHHNLESIRIDASWVDYLQDCGGDEVLDNFIHTKLVYNEKYENNLITWRGYFAAVKQKQMSPFPSSNVHALSILIKMEPTESATYADLVLSISQGQYTEQQAMFDALQKGDEVEFDAVLVGLGNEYKMHHLHGKKLEKTGNHKEIDDIIIKESTLP